MPDSYYPPRFSVEASNIHFGRRNNGVFGPYTGFPVLTYENLRVSNDESNEPPQEIFVWVDPQDVMKGNPDGYESWTGEDGDERYFGWRQCRRVPLAGHPTTTIMELFGPFFTDLVIVFHRDL